MSTVMELTSSAIRGVIVAPPGKKLVVADLSNIEGRVLAWLAGEEWKLQAFLDFDTFKLDAAGERIPSGKKKDPWERCGHDLYNLAYAKAFGVNPELVTKDERQVGKVMELALGYQGGVGAFLTFAAAYGIDLEAMGEAAIAGIPKDILAEAQDFMHWQRDQGRDQYGLSNTAFLVCESFKRLWREAHPAIASGWKELEGVCIAAVDNPGTTLTCRRHKIRRDGAWLRVRLPSGRYLCYPSPQVNDGKLTYMGIDQYTRKWQRLKTYGGKIAENITQAAARDVLASSMQPIEDAGYEIVLTVHDEIIAEAPDDERYNCEHLAALMSEVPEWATGLPLAAAGFESYRYKKE
ncbi:DNA polymerase [Herbaspirillum sp. RTI4]|uniref:DNA polymerase n=1 Tax=Herbaspirillum sp. RTI4 TaxID=3048640 RepID=UPI002AB469FE|nr:DNA polymerase [Herbaspirillum sp. RTI4]MDY7579383.1 DNA polymerase [Herbaspirillum sp. RTI4]MEA9980297.1 DNA polymerase [Herbaspirillum sp. RTI4]